MNPVHKINFILSLRLLICLPRDLLQSGFHSRNLYGFLSNACYMITSDFITVIIPPSHGATAPSGPGPPYCRDFTITLRNTTVGRTPMDGLSTRQRSLLDNSQHCQEKDILVLDGIRTRNPS